MELHRLPLTEWPEDVFLALHAMACQSQVPYATPGNREAFGAVNGEYRRRMLMKYQSQGQGDADDNSR